MNSYIKQGDCLQLMPDIPDGSVDMILCDLPYQATQNRWDVMVPVKQLWEQYKRIIKPNGAILLFGIPPFSTIVAGGGVELFRYSWYWHKPHTGQLNAKRMPLKNVEEIMVFYKKQPIYNPQFTYSTPYVITRKGYKGSECYGAQRDHTAISDGKRYPTQILDYKVEGKRLHPTQKPVALCEYLIKTYTNENDIVLDNCMGCGTTCIAAVQANRRYIGLELNAEYYNIAKQRIEDATEQLYKTRELP